MTTRRHFRLFWDPLPSERARWLDAMALSGWHLLSPGFFSWEFEKGEPRQVRHAVDMQSRWKWRQQALDTPAFPERTWQEEEREYLALAEGSGWSLVGRAGTCYVFRAKSEAAPEFHSDPGVWLGILQARIRNAWILPGVWGPHAVFRLIFEGTRGRVWIPDATFLFNLLILVVSLAGALHLASLLRSRKRLKQQLG